jgi:hypothetical protein
MDNQKPYIDGPTRRKKKQAMGNSLQKVHRKLNIEQYELNLYQR